MTQKGVRHAVPVWLKGTRWNLDLLEDHFEWLEADGSETTASRSRFAFDAVFSSAMA